MQEVLITGASSGIGAATAKIFSQNGWKVYLLGRSEEKLKRVQSELKNKSEILPFDLAQDGAFEKIEQRLSDLKSNISVLVNNAGIFKPASFPSDTDQSWQEQLNVNLMAPLRLTRLLWPQLLKNKGAVTNVSSTLGSRPLPGTGAYSASKAALNNWSKTLALESAAVNVRCNVIEPGLVDTPIHAFHSDSPENQKIKNQLAELQPMKRLAVADDIANVVYFVSTPEAGWMTGTIIPVDGGMSLTHRDS